MAWLSGWRIGRIPPFTGWCRRGFIRWSGPGVTGRRRWATRTDMRRNTLRYCALRGLLHHLPRLYRLARQIPAAVEDGDDINVLGFYPIDDAVVLKDQLSNIFTVGLWNLAPDLGMFGERFHGLENLLHKSPRVVRGVLRDVRLQFPQVGTGAGRPLNGHCPTARL